MQNLIDEHFRRVQLVYKEIVENSFKSVAEHFGFYWALPVRWDCVLIMKNGRYSWLYEKWFPVSSWNEIGADIELSKSVPKRFEMSDFSEIESLLLTYRRSECKSFTWNCAGILPRFDGYNRLGSFDGETTVVRAAFDLISDDIKRIFYSLPSRD